MSLTLAEKRLRKLARLAGNCVCANCGATSKVGFSTICIKYHTFVCSNCKTSHQAISHRCKSITMSTWTDAEVDELQQKGNDHARRTWLKHAPPIGSGGRPTKGDHVNVFKRFVVEVYERKRYYGADEGPQTQTPPPAHQARKGVSTAVPLSQASPVTRQAPTARAPVAAPAPAPVADLLDFSAAPQTFNQAAPAFVANFDAFQSSTPASAASQFGADFVSSTPVAPASKLADPFATQPTPTSSSASGFGFIKPPPAAPNVATTPSAAPATVSDSAFGFLSSASVPSTSTSNNDFADFSGMMTSTTASTATPAPAAKKPIMSNSSSPHASMISSMNMSAPSKSQSNGTDFGMSQHGFGGGMQSQPNMMMMQSNMMGMNAQQQQMMMMQRQQMMMQQNLMGMNMSNKNGMNSMMMVMMGGMNNNSSGTNNMMLGNQQQQNSMMSSGISNGGNSNQTMNSLDMNMSSMSAWTTGGKN